MEFPGGAALKISPTSLICEGALGCIMRAPEAIFPQACVRLVTASCSDHLTERAPCNQEHARTLSFAESLSDLFGTCAATLMTERELGFEQLKNAHGEAVRVENFRLSGGSCQSHFDVGVHAS